MTINVAPGPPTFPGSFYSFTLTNCLAGAALGQVSATSCGNAVSYSLLDYGGYAGSNPFYTINQLTGQLSVLSVPPPGTQTLTVQAISSNGQSLTVPVVVSSPCGQYNIALPSQPYYGQQMPAYGPQYPSQGLGVSSYNYPYRNGHDVSLNGAGASPNGNNNYLTENIIPYI